MQKQILNEQNFCGKLDYVYIFKTDSSNVSVLLMSPWGVRWPGTNKQHPRLRCRGERYLVRPQASRPTHAAAPSWREIGAM